MKDARPVANQYLQRQWDSRQFELHQQRLKEVRSSNYVSSPTRYKHLRSNRKKERKAEGKP